MTGPSPPATRSAGTRLSQNTLTSFGGRGGAKAMCSCRILSANAHCYSVVSGPNAIALQQAVDLIVRHACMMPYMRGDDRAVLPERSRGQKTHPQAQHLRNRKMPLVATHLPLRTLDHYAVE